MTYKRQLETKDDLDLGLLVYQDYQFNDQCNFDKKENICDVPFYDVEIKQNGDVYMCCPSWNPVIIGNLLDHDIREIWNSKKADTVRKSILDGSYRYCNSKTCPAMIAGGGHRIIPKNNFNKPQRKIPRCFSFSIDNTCNLMCPSCRKVKILTQDSEQKQKSLHIIKSIFKSVFSEPHNDEIIMTFDGLGEVFHSSIYREIFETEEAFRDTSKWPNFKVIISTNGTMMTEKIQQKYSYLFNRATSIRISVDAGNKSSYLKVRQGGNWEILWENLNYLYNSLLVNNNISWAWNLILQDDNYESLPELVDLAYQYKDNLPEIFITNILDWGIWSHEDFERKAVWLPSSPRHKYMKDILIQEKIIKYPKIYKPF